MMRMTFHMRVFPFQFDRLSKRTGFSISIAAGAEDPLKHRFKKRSLVCALFLPIEIVGTDVRRPGIVVQRSFCRTRIKAIRLERGFAARSSMIFQREDRTGIAFRARFPVTFRNQILIVGRPGYVFIGCFRCGPFSHAGRTVNRIMPDDRIPLRRIVNQPYAALLTFAANTDQHGSFPFVCEQSFESKIRGINAQLPPGPFMIRCISRRNAFETKSRVSDR